MLGELACSFIFERLSPLSWIMDRSNQFPIQCTPIQCMGMSVEVLGLWLVVAFATPLKTYRELVYQGACSLWQKQLMATGRAALCASASSAVRVDTTSF